MGNTVIDRELILESTVILPFGMCWRITSIWTNRSGHLLRE